MSMTAVPISMLDVRAPTAASSGNGDPSWRAKWCTRKYAPSAPSSSAATARSMDCRSASAPERVCDCDEGVQWPKERKPIFFMEGKASWRARLHGGQDFMEGKASRRARLHGGQGFTEGKTDVSRLAYLTRNSAWNRVL